MYSFSQSQKHAALEMLLLYQQHYWNLTENFCQITILFPWRKIRCIHQSADIFVKPFFWRNFVNIFLKRILKWTDCWLALPVLEWSGGDCFFFQLLLFWIFDVPNFWLHFIYTIKSQNEMNLKIFQVFEILKSNRLQNKTKDRIFSWRDKLYLQIFGSVLIAVEIYEEEIFLSKNI